MIAPIRKYSVLVLLLALLTACPNPTGQGGGGSSDSSAGDPATPGQVVASFSGGGITVSWNSVPGAGEYRVYRKDGLLSYELVGSGGETSFRDESYPKDVSVQYAVKSVSAGVSSPLSSPSESLSEWVRNLRVSRLEHVGKIRLSWQKQEQAEQYIVYRAESRRNTPVEIARFSSSDGTVEFDDESGDPNAELPVVDTPYFYQVRWIKAGVEYGASSPSRLGVYSATVDTGEPLNNDMATLGEGSFVFDPGSKPILYSFGDGDGGVESDTDWYKYEGQRGEVVTAKITELNAFSQGELMVEFRWSDGILKSESLPAGGEATCTIPPVESGPPQDADLFFRLRPATGSTVNKIGTYSITITNDF